MKNKTNQPKKEKTTKEVLDTVKVITDDFKKSLPELKKGDKCKAIEGINHCFDSGEIIEFLGMDKRLYQFKNEKGDVQWLIKSNFERIPEVKKTIESDWGDKERFEKENRITISSDSTSEVPAELNQVRHFETKMNKLIEENRELNANLRRVTTDLNRAKSDLSLKEGYLATAKRTIETRTKRIDYLERDLTDMGSDLRNSIELSNKRLRLIKVISLVWFIFSSLVAFLVGFNI